MAEGSIERSKKGWDWADLKAMELIPGEVVRAEAYRRDVAIALRDADARARAEERAHGAKALKLAHAMQENSVAAERENLLREGSLPDDQAIAR